MRVVDKGGNKMKKLLGLSALILSAVLAVGCSSSPGYFLDDKVFYEVYEPGENAYIIKDGEQVYVKPSDMMLEKGTRRLLIEYEIPPLNSTGMPNRFLNTREVDYLKPRIEILIAYEQVQESARKDREEVIKADAEARQHGFTTGRQVKAEQDFIAASDKFAARYSISQSRLKEIRIVAEQNARTKANDSYLLQLIAKGLASNSVLSVGSSATEMLAQAEMLHYLAKFWAGATYKTQSPYSEFMTVNNDLTEDLLKRITRELGAF
jgi:hypothetical protein